MKKKAETFLLGYLLALGYRIAFESYFAKDSNKEEPEFITINGTPVPIGKKGELKGRIGKKIEKDQVEKATKENKDDADSNEEQKARFSKLAKFRSSAPVFKVSKSQIEIPKGKTLIDGVKDYFRKHLENKPAHRDGFGDVNFYMTRINKFISTKLKNQDEMYLLPAVLLCR